MRRSSDGESGVMPSTTPPPPPPPPPPPSASVYSVSTPAVGSESSRSRSGELEVLRIEKARTDEQLATARSVLDLLPEPPRIARVDMVLTDTAALLMEVEVIEPELFVLHDPKAPDRSADLIQG